MTKKTSQTITKILFKICQYYKNQFTQSGYFSNLSFTSIHMEVCPNCPRSPACHIQLYIVCFPHD